ncbi:hypothetical protein KIMH_07740 [Bombiscardovia apis]|uniref:ABC3 transporter permease C-terminal domain-containing protein n=1 Tax=Bombiscardovia apis TaxID=2932182 RepID=A0ABN6SHE7_9BIFI|nr:ABC transporter permease [Bombiscardovia apis]BDR54663.1 hypothetical protein KIMH_07740 [Bombiscardovia apis]
MVTHMLFKKTLRDIRSQWGQFLSVFIMAMLTMLVFVGITSAGYGMQRSLDTYNEASQPADAWLNGRSITDDDVNAIRRLDTVAQAYAGQTFSAAVQSENGQDSNDSTLELNAVDREDIPKLDTVEGADFQVGTNEHGQHTAEHPIWVDADFAYDHDWKAGDNISLQIGKQTLEWTVQGLVHSAEYLYPADPDTSVPNHQRFGFAYTDLALLAPAQGVPTYTTVRLRVKQASEQNQSFQHRALENELRSQLGERFVSFSFQDTRAQTSSLQSRISKVIMIATLFSALFALVALSTMLTSISRLIGIQRLQIATMRALGISKTTIRLHYSSYALIVAGLGAVVGFALAPFTVSTVIMKVYEKTYWLPSWSVAIKPSAWLVLVMLVSVCMLAALAACGPGVKRAPGLELSTTSSTSSKATPRALLEHFPHLWAHTSGNWRWTMRNMQQGKLRTLMGLLGSMGCMVLLCAGFGAQSAAQNMPGLLYGKQYTYQTKVTLDPRATADPARSEQVQANVENAANNSGDAGSVQWVEEQPMQYRDDDSQTAFLNVVGPGSFVSIADSKGKQINLDEGAVLTQQAAQALGVKPGDKLAVRTASSQSYIEVPIHAVAYAPVSQGLIISQQVWTQELNQTFNPTAALLGTSESGLKDVDGVLRVASFDSQKDGLVQNVASFASIFAMLKLAALFLGLVVLYNLGVLNYSEEERQYATMRVLGFRQGQIRSSILRENCSLSVIGWLLGIPAAIAFLKIYLGSVASSTMAFNPELSPTDLGLASLLTLGSSVLVALVVSRRVKRIDMAQALMAGE